MSLFFVCVAVEGEGVLLICVITMLLCISKRLWACLMSRFADVNCCAVLWLFHLSVNFFFLFLELFSALLSIYKSLSMELIFVLVVIQVVRIDSWWQKTNGGYLKATLVQTMFLTSFLRTFVLYIPSRFPSSLTHFFALNALLMHVACLTCAKKNLLILFLGSIFIYIYMYIYIYVCVCLCVCVCIYIYI